MHSDYINSIIELHDKRIALFSNDKSISINSIDFDTKTWKKEIQKEKTHHDKIFDICEINTNALTSVSADNEIKIWKIDKKELSHITTLKKHSSCIYKVISILENKFSKHVQKINQLYYVKVNLHLMK